MILTKRTDAWHELCGLMSRGKLNRDAVCMFNTLVKTDQMKALDFVVVNQFPNGASIDELNSFFNEEARFICEKIGVLDKFYEYND